MICLLNFLRYRTGVNTSFGSDYENQGQNQSNQGYDINQDTESNDYYRQAPFNNNLNNSSYQQPAY